MLQSLPAWGAWVEISANAAAAAANGGRSPHGERGLKFSWENGKTAPSASLPAWGAWVEICPCPQ